MSELDVITLRERWATEAKFIGLVARGGNEVCGGSYQRQPSDWRLDRNILRSAKVLEFDIPAKTVVIGWRGYPSASGDSALPVVRFDWEEAYVTPGQFCLTPTASLEVAETLLLQATTDAVIKTARAVLPDTHPTDWWCPRCFRWVPGREVNHDETHDVCGSPVGVPEDDPKVTALRVALTALDALRGGERA